MCAAISTRSQSDIEPGPRSAGLGETGLGFSDINAAYTNPAGLHGLSGFSIQANITRPFSIKELSRAQLAAATNLSKTGFVFGTLSGKSTSGYQQTRISTGYGRKLISNLSIALEFETLMLFLRGYGNSTTIGYGLSLQHRPFTNLIVGVHIRNPVPVFNEGPVIPKSTFSAGISYMISTLVYVNIEAFKDTQFKLRIKSGIEYHPHPVFTLRFGATTNPAQFHFGFGWLAKERMIVDFSVAYHTLLGITPSVGVGYTVN